MATANGLMQHRPRFRGPPPERMKPAVDVGRLVRAIESDRRRLQVYRLNRSLAVSEYAGANWSDNAAQDRQPLNLLSVYVSTIGRNLVAKNPRARLSTWNRADRRAVAIIQESVNDKIEAMHLAVTLKRCVLDALFCMGMAKVALADPGEAAATGYGVKAGDPFASWVDLDDLVFDTNARDIGEAGYVGHRFRVPYSVVEDSPLYRREFKQNAKPNTFRKFNREGDERIGMQGRGWWGADEEFEDRIDLWEVYLPRFKQVITLGSEDGGNPDFGLVARVQEWVGPDCGPYYPLGFGVVPGNPVPKGPIADLIDLHVAGNNLWRKLIRQATRQKTLLAYEGSASDDASRMVRAADGESVRVDGVDRIKEVSWGGPNQGNFLIAKEIQNLFDFIGGNLALLGGRSPQARTLGQDKMLNENASAGVADMQDATTAWVGKVIQGLVWYETHSPFGTTRTEYSPRGAPEVRVPQTLTPRDRAGVRHADMKVRVDPYSLTTKPPSQVLAELDQAIQTIILPSLPLLQQQGIAIDLNWYLQKRAELTDLPELTDLVTVQEPPAMAEGGGPGAAGQDQPGKPSSTHREYTRRSVAGGPQQQGQAASAAALGGMSNGEMNGPLNKV